MTIDLSRVRAICFDVDGTLSDTDDRWIARLQAWLRPARILFPNGDTSAFARRLVMGLDTPINWVYDAADWVGGAGFLDRVYGRLASRHTLDQYHFTLTPGCQQALDELSDHYLMAIITARGEDATLRFLKQFGLGDYFSAVASRDTCQRGKPYPDPILWVAEQIGVEPGDCLMVGDTVVDIKAGRAARAQTVGLLSGFDTRRDLERARADLILPGMPELADLLIPK